MTYYGQDLEQRAEIGQASNSVLSSTSSSTTTGARAHARTRESAAQMLYGQYQDACQYYAESFRRSITPIIQRQIAEWIKGGITAEVVRMAIDETQMAPRPSWAYCAAILRRCENEGITTLAAWQADKARYAARLNPATNYQQRKYTDDDYGPDFFLDLG